MEKTDLILTVCLNCGFVYSLKKTDEDKNIDLLTFNFCPQCGQDADEDIVETRYKKVD
jgi:rubredoxin